MDPWFYLLFRLRDPKPHRRQHCFQTPRGSPRLFALSLLLGILSGTGWPARAAEPVPGRDLASIRAWLLKHNPELQALQADIEAAQARVLPAGALPNPMASVELDDIDRDRPRLSPSQVGTP